ncbi:MAG TPA: electron transport complex subunit RsxC [Patescibacteria group bacterium]|nr:electron transport complex subunit RsxC [Patescibacteria group bacterium]
MVRLEEHKEYTADKPIEKLKPPAKVYIPLAQHLGKVCVPEVKPGDAVLAGQRIAGIQAHVWAPVHASISGKVSAIQDWPHPVLGKAKAIVIEDDGLDKTAPSRSRSAGEIAGLSASQIQKIVLEAGVVGMGGASFPTHVKLAPPKPVDTLIVNGAECEPFLTGDSRLMVERTEQIISGIEVVARCLGARHVYVAIEDNKPQAIEAFSRKAAHFNIRVLRSQYPQGGEKQLIRTVLKKEVPRGKLPFDVGVVVHNVATLLAVYEAVYLDKPLYERVVTVAGSSLSSPRNLLVRIGTPIKELIDHCGPPKEEPAKIIVGGPMMGIAQFTDTVPVIKSTNGIILFTEAEARMNDEQVCIRCGACVRNCPAGLMPCLINLASEKTLWPEAKTYGALDCIECGSCNYVCPANRRMVQSIKRAKLELSK